MQYLNGENLGDGYGDRRSVFDVYCMAKDGSRFIVEMQKAEQTYFKDRSVYYSTTPIRQQAPKGEWDYHLDEQAEIARYSETERRQYEESKKVFWDNYSVLKTASENRAKEIAREMKSDGIPTSTIVKYTKLTTEEIEAL